MNVQDEGTEGSGLCDFANISESTPEPESEPEPMALLPPDHPLLRKFQQSLREHLLRTKQKLENEIAEIKCEVKAKEQRREEQGLSLYEMQQKIVLQGDQIREITTQIEEQVENRTNEEKVVATLKQEYEEKIKSTKTVKGDYHKMMVELEDLQTLGSNIKKWADDVEDEVKNAKRIVSRDAQLQKQLSEEKRKSDILFYRLNMEVKKRESELENIGEEETAMTEVINILNMSISDANTDLEALQSEHKRLTQAWSEVIIAIQLRDKILYQVTENLRKLQESIKLNTTGIEAIKKQISKEMELNRKLESFKQRLAEDFNSLKRDCQKETDSLTALQVKLDELPMWLASTEKDLQEAAREGTKVQNEIRRLNFKLDKQHFKKFQIEEEILKLAQDQLITDKASAYRLKLLNKSQEQRRKMDIALSKTQNQLATSMVDLERMRGQLFNIEQENTELQSKLDAAEAKSDSIDADLKEMYSQIDLKMKRFEKINQQIEDASRDFDDSATNPTELKIKQTEKLIHNAEQQIREHQQFWIMLQNHFVNLSQKRNDQLNEIQVTRKQLSIIMQKSLKIDQDLETAETRMKELNLDIQKYTSKLELLNDRVYKKRQQHESEESFCEIEHFELTKKLKESEMNILVIESEIDDITTDIELHKDLVLDKHRESLSWETKYKLIEETIRWHKTEQALDSDISVMKTEIHRMNIRYNQLRRAQEKLVQDLEHCVMHREQIFFSATVKEHVDTKFVHAAKHSQTQLKLQDLRNKIKIVDNDMTMWKEKRLAMAISDIAILDKVMMKINEDLKQVKVEDENLRTKINECVLLKHANLELIVRKQNRAKAYRKLMESKPPFKTPRTEAAIKTQTQKQMEMNDILLDIIQTCINDFPDRKAFFTKLLHVVKD